MPTPRIAAALLTLSTAASLHGQTRIIYVDQTGPANGNGASWAQAYRDLNAALVEVNAGLLTQATEVRIAQGTYRPTVQHVTVGFELHPRSTNSAVTLNILGCFAGLRGAIPNARDYAATPTIVSGDVNGDDGANFANRNDNAQTVMNVTLSYPASPRLTIDGLTVRGGHGSGYGGGLSFYASNNNLTATISQCRFTDSDAYYGGGIYQSDGAVTFDRCRMDFNRVSQSGGGACTSTRGASLTACELSNNSAVGGGGGAYTQGRVSRSTIAENSGSSGGGLYGGFTADNCLIIRNTAIYQGGGLYNSSGLSLVTACTIIQNSATNAGGGVWINDLRLSSSIVAMNSAVQGPQIATSSGYVDIRYSILEGGRGAIYRSSIYDSARTMIDSHTIDTTPGFRDLFGPDNNIATWRDNDYRLSPGSPAIDAGDSDVPLSPATLDLDGRPRFLPGVPGRAAVIDIGCYESGQPRCPADLDDGSMTGTPDGGVTVDDLLFFLSRFAGGC